MSASIIDLSPEGAAMRHHWKYRVATLLRDNAETGDMALIFFAMCHPRRRNYLPRMGPNALVDTHGHVKCWALRADGSVGQADWGPIDKFNDGWRKVADHLKLNDQERIALFDLVRGWIIVDHSPKPDTKTTVPA